MTTMTTGDLKGSLRKLQTSLRSIKYTREVDYKGLAKGDPSSCLPIISYAFTSFSSAVAENLVESGLELTGRNDLSFTETVYKILRDLFSYKPLLTKQQFLQFGFAERKVGLVCDIIGFVQDKHRQLTKSTKSVSPPKRRLLSRSKSTECSTPKELHRMPTQTERAVVQAVVSRPLVERHLGCSTPAQFSLSSDEPPQQREDDEDEEERTESRDSNSSRPAAHTECVSEDMLKAVEAGLQECVCRLGQQLNLLDTRLQALEKSMAGKIIIEHRDWENLQSRVLLLETRLTLSSAQDPVRAGEVVSFPAGVENRHLTDETEADKGPVKGSSVLLRSVSDSGSASYSPSNLQSGSSEENIKERLERIASMMKDTSSLLKNIEPTI